MLEITRALHAMAAHCLRYKTELDTISVVVMAVLEQHEEISDQLKLGACEKDRVRRAMKQQLAEVAAITRSLAELSKKTKNALALVSVDGSILSLSMSARNHSFPESRSYSILSKPIMTSNKSSTASHFRRSRGRAKPRPNRRERTAGR